MTENSLIKGPNRLGASLSEHGNSRVLKRCASLKKSVNEQSPPLPKKRGEGETESVNFSHYPLSRLHMMIL